MWKEVHSFPQKYPSLVLKTPKCHQLEDWNKDAEISNFAAKSYPKVKLIHCCHRSQGRSDTNSPGMRQIMIAVTTFTTCWGLSLYRLLFLLMMSCTTVFLKMWHLHHWETTTLGSWCLWSPPDFIICILRSTTAVIVALKGKARDEVREETFSMCLPTRIKCEQSSSTHWVITQVVVDLHLSTFCCRRHWLHSHKSGKVQCLTLSTPLPCLFCNPDQSLEVSIELVYWSRCCQSKWIMGKIKDIWSQEAVALAYFL